METFTYRFTTLFSPTSLRMRLQMLVWVAIIPVVVLTVSESMLDRSRKESEVRGTAVGLVNLAKGSLEQYINDTKSLLLAAAHLDVMQNGDPSSISTFLNDLLEHYPAYANYGAVDLEGNVFASAIPMKKAVNAADMFWFQQTLKSRAFTVGEYQTGKISGLEVIVFGQPVFDKGGKMKFILFASMELKWMNSLWDNITLLPDSTFTVTDRSGVVLFRYPLASDKWVGKKMTHVPIVTKMLTARKGITETDGLDSKYRIYAFTETEPSESRIHLAVGVSKQAALKPANNSLVIDLVVIALVAALGLFLARFYSSRYIIKPIKALEDAAGRLASGDYSSRINLSKGDNEFILMGAAFDRMAETVEREIAVREKSEALTKDILETVDEGFIIIDPDYRIVSANRAFCEQMNMPVCDIIGRHCYEVSHHRETPCFMNGEECTAREAFTTGAPHRTIHTHYDKENTPVYVETKSYPLRDSSGQVTAVIETQTNVTEKRKLEEQLRHAHKMEAIGTLAGGIAHDFNNMLSIINGYAGLMQMHMKPDDPQIPRLNEILAAGERAAQLTKGLLAFSRKLVMEIKTVNINEIVGGFNKMLARIIGEDIELRIITADEELTAKVDTGQIEQVLMNLAVNARDAMPKGGALTVETRSVEIDEEFIRMYGYGEPGRHALIAVSDTGGGMDETTMARIFDPYFTTKEPGKGTGLGLAIVYGIVTRHNGFIRCYSEPGEGTTFRIYIPLVTAAAEEIETEEAPAPKGGAETVLIAEDDANVRSLIRNILEGFGYTVIAAVDGNDAVEKFRADKDTIELFLSDLIMPGKNGKDAYEEIKTIRHDIRVIFISGYAREIIQRFGIDEEIEFISKPVLPNELLRKVRKELDR